MCRWDPKSEKDTRELPANASLRTKMVGLVTVEPLLEARPTRGPPPHCHQKWSVDKLMEVLSLKFATQSSSVRRAFRAVAVAGTDRIGVDQFKRWLHTLNLGVGGKLARKLFERLDTDSSGSITYEEFRLAFGETISGSAYEGRAFEPGQNEHEQRVKLIEAVRSKNEPAFSNVDECVTVLKERMATQHTKVRNAFRILDRDHSGELERPELRRMVETYNIRLDEKALDELMRRMGCDLSDKTKKKGVTYRMFNDFFGADIAGSSFRNSAQMEESTGAGNAAFAEYMSHQSARPRKQWTTSEFLSTFEAVLSSRSKTVRRIFRMCDTDQSGLIDVDEFHACMNRLNIAMTRDEAKKFFRMFDDSNSGTLSYAELMEKIGSIVAGFKDTGVLTMKGIERTDLKNRRSLADSIAARQRVVKEASLPRHTVPQIKEMIARRLGNKYSSACAAFRQIDRSHSGTISRADFELFLKFRNIELHPQDLEAVMDDLDADKDGIVEYKEFLKSFGDAICGTPWESLQTSLNTPADDLAAMGLSKSVELLQRPVKKLSVEAALAALHVKLGETCASVNRLFKRYNKGRSGKLEPSQIALIFRNYNLDIEDEDVEKMVAILESKHPEVPNESKRTLSYQLFCAEFGPSISGHKYEGIRDPLGHFTKAPPSRLPPPAPNVDANTAHAMLLEKLAVNFAHVRKAFVNFNTERDGVLDRNELRRALNNFNIQMKEADFQEFVNKFEADESGAIRFDKFLKNVGVAVSGDRDTGLSICMQDRDEIVKAKRQEFEANFLQILDDSDDDDQEEEQPASMSLPRPTEQLVPLAEAEMVPPQITDENILFDRKRLQRALDMAAAKKRRPPIKLRLIAAAAQRRQNAINLQRSKARPSTTTSAHWRSAGSAAVSVRERTTSASMLHSASTPHIATHAA